MERRSFRFLVVVMENVRRDSNSTHFRLIAVRDILQQKLRKFHLVRNAVCDNIETSQRNFPTADFTEDVPNNRNVQRRLAAGEGQTADTFDTIQNLVHRLLGHIHVLGLAPKAVFAAEIAAAGDLENQIEKLHLCVSHDIHFPFFVNPLF